MQIQIQLDKFSFEFGSSAVQGIWNVQSRFQYMIE